jgi:antitoxin HicB
MRKIETNGKRRAKNARSKKNGRTLATLIKLPYTIELRPLSKRDGGGYMAAIPLLKGCQSDGKTPDEAITNLREAQLSWLESALKHGDAIPIPRAS